MNSVLMNIGQQALTMTSREIAELTGKEHRNVLRDLDVLRNQLGELFVGSAQTWAHPQNGQRYPEYVLDKDTTICLVAGYDAVVRMRIIKRWQELEAQQAPAIPQTMSQALRLAAEQAEALERQQQQLQAAAPKVEFVDRYVKADSGAMNLRDVCKMLVAKQNEFTDWLLARGIMYRTTPHGPLTPSAAHMHTGRFVAKTGVAEHTEKSHAYVHYKFTPKGVEWIAGEWAKHQVAQKVVVA
jgi:phage antirepressor YoqD-like protein